jgi:hypothetical protein
MTAMQQPPLDTERIALVPLEDAHLEHEIELDAVVYVISRAEWVDRRADR